MKLMRPLAMLCALTLTFGSVGVLAATQGSQEDPLLTLSYLEKILRPQLDKEVETAVAQGEAALEKKLSDTVADYEDQVTKALSGAQAAFQTKTLAKGERFTPGAGRELLCVSGSFTALGSLSDTTSGQSVAAGQALELGHLYITTADNAGCTATAAASVMSR